MSIEHAIFRKLNESRIAEFTDLSEIDDKIKKILTTSSEYSSVYHFITSMKSKGKESYAKALVPDKTLHKYLGKLNKNILMYDKYTNSQYRDLLDIIKELKVTEKGIAKENGVNYSVYKVGNRVLILTPNIQGTSVIYLNRK